MSSPAQSNRHWTEDEDAFLVQCVNEGHTYQGIAKAFERTEKAIAVRAHVLRKRGFDIKTPAPKKRTRRDRRAPTMATPKQPLFAVEKAMEGIVVFLTGSLFAIVCLSFLRPL